MSESDLPTRAHDQTCWFHKEFPLDGRCSDCEGLRLRAAALATSDSPEAQLGLSTRTRLLLILLPLLIAFSPVVVFWSYLGTILLPFIVYVTFSFSVAALLWARAVRQVGP